MLSLLFVQHACFLPPLLDLTCTRCTNSDCTGGGRYPFTCIDGRCQPKDQVPVSCDQFNTERDVDTDSGENGTEKMPTE
ncbi:MAG: hypothetical protein AAGJ35_06960 [Myxococcota bacterium]